MEKIRNQDYKPPKDVYVCDFYSEQLAEIANSLLWIEVILICTLMAILFK